MRREQYDRDGTTEQNHDFEEAIAAVAHLMLTLIDKAGDQDIVRLACETVKLGQASRSTRIVEGRFHIRKYEMALKRLRRKSDKGSDFIRAAIEGEIAEKHKRIASIEREIRVGDVMLGMIADYEYQPNATAMLPQRTKWAV